MKYIKESLMVCLMTFAFWGVMYPQFSLVKESYELIYETDENKENDEEVLGGKEKESQNIRTKNQEKKNPQEDLFWILNADRGKIVIKSKLWELWKK